MRGATTVLIVGLIGSACGDDGAVTRGSLEGLVLVSENVSIRRIQFEGGGVVTDLGLTSLSDGVPAIAGAVGVQY
jgi:hypothetical protein